MPVQKIFFLRTQMMNSDPGILCFKHCHSSIFCQSMPQVCPICRRKLADSNVLPFRIPFPFIRAKQNPCAIVMKPSNGTFLNCYSTNNTDLHIGITTSKAVVVEFDVNGLTNSNTDSWNECLIVYELKTISWYQRWDILLRDAADKRCFSSERYEENTFNCYSFVLAFVKRLQHEDLKKSSVSKEVFCEDLVIPRLAEAWRYISLYREVNLLNYPSVFMMGMSISRDSSHIVRVTNNSSVTNQLNDLLNYLILNGQLNIHDFEEYLEESDDSDFDYPVATVHPPKIHFPLNTTTLNQSDIRVLTGQSCGLRKKRTLARPKNIVNMLGMQKIGMPGNGNFTHGDMCKIANYRVPCNFNKEIDKYSGKTFVGVFSDDGSRLLTVSQDRNLHLYDSSTPRYTHMKQEKGKDIDWSILDAAFSPDDKTVIFSSWSNCLHSWRINDDSDPAGSAQDKLVIREAESRYACFSVCFSYDGSYILTGVGDGCVYVYDRHRDKRTLQLPAHAKDVNAVRFGSYGDNVILSGSDDGLIKVWDRRIVNPDSPKEVGVFSGHRDGITYLDMKGDGRHFISNSKDQTVKLWDMRKFSNLQISSQKSFATPEWDYRWQPVPKQLQSKTQLPEDTSVMTYRGHAVLRTLIRSKFSPVRTTGQRYIYTGCATGRVVVYDLLTGLIEKIINGHKINVRDVSWHPTRPEIVTTSWDSSVKLWDSAVPMNDEFEDGIPAKRVRRSARIAARKRIEAERIRREARLHLFADGAGPSIC